MSQIALRPLVVFADDWGRHPSSCQHLVGKLLDHREVIWVNTIGTRPPRFDWGTAKRVAGKLRSWFAPATKTNDDSQKKPQPRVISPKMWPSFRSRFGRSMNRKLLVRSLRPLFESLPQKPNVVTTLPLVADLIGELPVHRWTYYCVDDFSVWPGYDGETMQRMERELVPKVDEIVAVSETLVQHIQKLGRTSHLLTHGVDLDHWTIGNSIDDELPISDWYSEIQTWNCKALFWGVIDRRLDLNFVRKLSDALCEGTILFVGPQEDPDPELFQIPRVRTHSAIPFQDLPHLADLAPVLIMPYADLPVTRAMQPLKLKEYLATGKPVVVRELPATIPWADACDVCQTESEFAQSVLNFQEGIVSDNQKLARERLSNESWVSKARDFKCVIDGSAY